MGLEEAVARALEFTPGATRPEAASAPRDPRGVQARGAVSASSGRSSWRLPFSGPRSPALRIDIPISFHRLQLHVRMGRGPSNGDSNLCPFLRPQIHSSGEDL